MESFQMNYSSKNIPLHSRRDYLKRLLEKVESVVKRMRWRAFFFLDQDNSENETTSESSDGELDNEDLYGKFGFKSKNTPPQIDEMADFEKDIFDMVENIEFKQVS